MLSSEFDYTLPEKLIAHVPCEKRDESRLMVLNRQDRIVLHKNFYDLIDVLDKNDVLVMNNTKVIPARLLGKKDTGANIEIFLLEKIQDNIWECLAKPSKRLKTGIIVSFSRDTNAKILDRLPNDKWLIEFVIKTNEKFDDILLKTGIIPLPPYIEKKRQKIEEHGIKIDKNFDLERYQTVYAQTSGSVAAPTAGLHFTPEIIEKLEQKGVEICYVTLNIGLGTFKPVKADNILEHKMEKEFYSIPESTAKTINNAKQHGKNIVAVGTTTVRTLESAFQKDGCILETAGWSELFIYPGYEFKAVDKLITNFHLPKSTLLMLVSALAGKNFVMDAYKEAIEKNYRFYSYGDCMFIN